MFRVRVNRDRIMRTAVVVVVNDSGFLVLLFLLPG